MRVPGECMFDEHRVVAGESPPRFIRDHDVRQLATAKGGAPLEPH